MPKRVKVDVNRARHFKNATNTVETLFSFIMVWNRKLEKSLYNMNVGASVAEKIEDLL